MPTIPPADSDWQAGKTLLECTQFMLEPEIACDVPFLLGETKQEVRAHSFIIISRSPVFSSMLCNPMAEKQAPIVIPDIKPEVFRTVLRYMYSDQVQLDEQNIWGTLYAASKYRVTRFVIECREYISNNIDENNACAFLHHADRLDEQALVQTCFPYVLKKGEECLKSDSFCKISRNCVRKIVQANDLKACELSVWDALVRWAEAECETGRVAISSESIRGDLVHCVSFVELVLKTWLNISQRKIYLHPHR